MVHRLSLVLSHIGWLCENDFRRYPKTPFCYGAFQGRLCSLCVVSSIIQNVLRATSYSTVSYSAWSGACDACMFLPEKICPDSPLEGKYMLDGMFVFLICSLSLYGLFPPSVPLPSPAPFMTALFSPCASTFYLLLLFISPHSFSCLSLSFWLSFCFCLSAVPRLPLSQCSVSCGGGVQTRSTQCLQQGRPAAGCLPHQRPVTSRACNTHFCAAAPPAPAQRSGWITASGPTLKGKFLREKKTNSSI